MKNDIVNFIQNNPTPDDFNHLLYQQKYPETETYYKPFCDMYNISDRDRLYHHYEFYGKHQDYIKNESELTRSHTSSANVFLYTTYFLSDNYKRQEELEHCLISNINNPLIREINIFVNQETKESLSVFLKGSKKVNYIDCDETPTYKMWIENCNMDWGVNVFANADITFDESIQTLNAWVGGNRRKRIVCLSRHNIVDGKAVLHENPHWSQDAWAISGEDLGEIDFLESLAIPTGKYRCDNKVAYEFAVNGWDLFNPCKCQSMLQVKCFHHHESNVRTYDKKDKSVIGSVCYVHPCRSPLTPSRLEYEIMPLSTRNVISCKLSDYLSIDTIDIDDFNKHFNFNIPQDNDTVTSWNGLAWQTPATTEKDAYIDHFTSYSEKSMDHTYFGFPWATLIDKCDRYRIQLEKAYELLPNKPKPLNKNKRNHTVCQHIKWKEIIPICKKLNITDIHASHCEKHDDRIDSVNLHPWKISAANFINSNLHLSSQRKYFLSFLGAHDQWYRSDIRYKLKEYFEKHKNENLFYEISKGWCYQEIVYNHQIYNNTWTTEQENDLRKKRERYNDVLSNSVFSICPEGSGPNTIRLWESMSVGVVPVIFSDKWKPPVLKNMRWEDFSVFIPQSQYNDTLEILSSINPKKVNEMQVNAINAYIEFTKMRCF
tara:strand:- start:913 stop:2886 length:1974 start_codon:yes stop_codon:yes gene_type:complete